MEANIITSLLFSVLLGEEQQRHTLRASQFKNTPDQPWKAPSWFILDSVLRFRYSITHLDTLAPIYHAPAGNSAVRPPVLPWAEMGCMKQWFSGFHGSSSIHIGAKNQGSPEETLGVNSFNKFNDVTQCKEEVEEEESWNGKEVN